MRHPGRGTIFLPHEAELLLKHKRQADTVYRLGNWEYSYIFRDAPDSAAYSALRYGAFVLELKSHLTEVMQGTSELKYFHNVRCAPSPYPGVFPPSPSISKREMIASLTFTPNLSLDRP